MEYETTVAIEETVGETSGFDVSLETLPDNSYVAVLTADEVELLSNYDDYTDGTISTTVLSYFEGIVPKIGDNDYVLFRDEQYVYRFAYGDMEYADGMFSGDVDMITYTASSGYSSTYSVDYSEDATFSLSPSGVAVYSNLGMYPELTTAVSYYQFHGLLFGLAVAAIVAFIMPFFGYGLRKRGIPRAKNY